MKLSSSLLLAFATTIKDTVASNCDQCLNAMYPAFKKCATLCESGLSTLPRNNLTLEDCQAQCGNEVDTCNTFSYCSGPSCNPRQWLKIGALEGETDGQMLGSFSVSAYSGNRAAFYDNNYECDDNSPGINCKGAAQVYNKIKGTWTKELTIPGVTKGEYFALHLSMSKNGAILAIGGKFRWVIKGFDHPFECVMETDESEVRSHTVAVSPNGKYVALALSSSLGTNELKVLKLNTTIPGDCPFDPVGDVRQGIKYDFGSISIDNSGEHVLFGNHDVSVAGRKGGIGMLYLDDITSTWEFDQTYMPTDGQNANSPVVLSANGKVAAVSLSYFNGFQGKVAVYIFDKNNKNFTSSTELVGPSEGKFSFGVDLDLNNKGNILAIGASSHYDVKGFVVVFKGNPRLGKYEMIKNTLKGIEIEPNINFFGASVALNKSGEKMMVSAVGSLSRGKSYEFNTCGLLK